MALPTNASARKAVPIFSGVLKYFPDALAAVAHLSLVGNEQHNPGKPLHWDRSKSGDELDALTRHLMEAGNDDTDGVRHSTKLAWRALANLQKEIEADQSHEIPEAQDLTAHEQRVMAQHLESVASIKAGIQNPTQFRMPVIAPLRTENEIEEYVRGLNENWKGECKANSAR